MPKNASKTSVSGHPGVSDSIELNNTAHRRNNQAYAVTQALGEAPRIERVVSEYVAQCKKSVLKWPRHWGWEPVWPQWFSVEAGVMSTERRFPQVIARDRGKIDVIQ